MKYSNIILLSDMDGTLLDTDFKLSDKNKAAIEYFTSQGGRFGVATGRGVRNAALFLPEGLVNFQSVFLNGSILYDFRTNQVMKANHLDRDNILPVVKKCLAEHPNIAIQVYTDMDGFFISGETLTDSFFVEDHMPYGFADVDTAAEHEWAKILFSAQPEPLKWVEKNVAPLRENKIVDGVYSSKIYYEILPVGSNKGEMIKYISKNPDDIIYAVGNYYNDAELIKKADIGIFTKNAPEDLKPLGAYVCADCDEDAIADVIYNIMQP